MSAAAAFKYGPVWTREQVKVLSVSVSGMCVQLFYIYNKGVVILAVILQVLHDMQQSHFYHLPQL